MLAFVVPAAVVVVCAFWVYFDATSHRIGKVADVKGFFNMSAGGWAAATMFLWIAGFPSYLVKRASLIEIAKAKPVEVRFRSIRFAALALAGAALIAGNVAMAPSVELPACDSENAQQLLRSIPSVKAVTDSGARFTNPREAFYDAAADKRTCTIVLAKDGQTAPVTYTISWQNESAGEYSLQIVPYRRLVSEPFDADEASLRRGRAAAAPSRLLDRHPPRVPDDRGHAGDLHRREEDV